MADVNVAILGLDRLGASFGLALKRYMQNKEAHHTFTITGYDQGYNTKHAKKIGAIDSSERSADGAVAKAHIVLLATHYYKVPQLYEIFGPALPPGSVVLDMSPLKRKSIEWADRNLPHDPERAAYMVGLTPILNPGVLYDSSTEVEAARADLFDGGTIILAPDSSCPAEAVELAAEVTRIIGASAHFMDPDEHDGLIAATEGLPTALAVALFQAMIRAEGWDDLQRLANPAFGLVTHQLHYQHPDSLWGMLHYNRENTVRHLNTLIQTLTEIRDGLQSDEEGLGLEAVLTESAAKFEEWEGHRLTNRWRPGTEGGEPLPSGNVLSSMGGFLFGRRPNKDEDKQ
jgi:prephenate dehydrogenase